MKEATNKIENSNNDEKKGNQTRIDINTRTSSSTNVAIDLFCKQQQ